MAVHPSRAPGRIDDEIGLERLTVDDEANRPASTRIGGFGDLVDMIGATLFVRWLRDRGWLRRGASVRHGAEVCWLLMDPTAFRWLVTERGWSRRQFDRYLVETL